MFFFTAVHLDVLQGDGGDGKAGSSNHRNLAAGYIIPVLRQTMYQLKEWIVVRETREKGEPVIQPRHPRPIYCRPLAVALYYGYAKRSTIDKKIDFNSFHDSFFISFLLSSEY